MQKRLTLSLLLASVLGLTACASLTMPSAQVPFPDVSRETQPCKRKVEANGEITPTELAVENAVRLEECADQLDSLANIIKAYIKGSK